MADETTSAEQKLINKYKAEAIELQGKINNLEEDSRDIIAGSVEEAQKELELQKTRGALLLKNLELEKTSAAERLKSGEITKQELDDIEELYKKQRKSVLDILKAEEKKLDLLKKEEERTKSIKKNVLGIVEAEQTRLTTLNDIIKAVADTTPKEAFMSFVAKLQEAAGLIFVAAEAFNATTSALNKATNSAGKYDSMVANIASSNIRMGMTFDDAANSIGALYEGFGNFTNMSEEAQADLANFTAQMDKAGISSSVTARLLTTATKSFGMSVDQTKAFSKELFQFSRANNISMKAINDGLATMMPRLAAFGKEGPRIFKEMTLASKNLGIEMGKLLDITEGFTTFEGAAEAAGNLNAVLGGNYLDTMELLRAANEDPIQAMNMLRETMDASGKSFNQLDNQTKRLMADIMKMDVDTASKFFSQTTEQSAAAAKQQEDFNDAVAKFTSIGDKLKSLMTALAPTIKVVAQALGYLVDILAWIAESTIVQFFLQIMGVLAVVTAGIFIVVGAFMTFAGQLMLLWKAGSFVLTFFRSLKSESDTLGEAVKNMLSKVTDGIKDATENIGDSIKNVVEKSVDAVKSVAGSIGSVIQKIASAVGRGFQTLMRGIAAGFRLFAEGIKSLGNPAVLKGILIAGLITVIILGLAAAVYIVVSAIANLFEVLMKGGSAALIAAASVLVFSAGIYVLALAMGLFANVGAAGVIIFGLLAIGAMLFANAITSIADSMKIIGEAFKSIESLKVEKLTQLKNAFKEIADEMKSVVAAAVSLNALLLNPVIAAAVIATATRTPDASDITSKAKETAAGVESAKKSQPIEITLNFDAPVKINDKEIGKIATNTIVRMNYTGEPLQANTTTPTSQATQPKFK
jgi:phage-related protein